MSTIQQLFQEFVQSGGEPKVTSFKRHLDQLINSDIKQLCGRSAKSAIGEDWRSELKDRFGGRGAKWVKVSIEEILPTLSRFENEGINCSAYSAFINSAGFAWIRFSGPRVDGGVQCAAFEVRTGGSTIDHPGQLHYVPVSELNDKISPLNSTPHAMKLEEVAMPQEVEIEIESSEDQQIETQTELASEVYEDVMGDIEELMAEEEDEF